MTTEEPRNKRRRVGATQPPASTEVPSQQNALPMDVLNLEAIREIIAQEIHAALEPILDVLAVLETETRKTRRGLDAFHHRFALPIVPQLKDERGEEEWLEESQGEEVAANPFPHLQPRGQSGRTSFRAGLPVKEPVMLEILPRSQKEVK